ncbi:unnamed protein product [Cladocopium goreaui]|uniref:Uncharacterized protein n=1 Tax=Cladocopium goreaui TaxID=2562237 RepID=A0A9P1DL00_9DINO|nr:unnamed protein product [Cladocopium goreaui]
MDPMCSSDSPLLGWICQLNYGCGGLLTLHDTSQHVPFSTSTLPLRIGQKVSFRIRFADKIEAVDLQVSSIQARDGLPAEHVSSSSQQSPTGNVIQEAARSCSGLQRQIRRLQRGILKFSNAAKVEQYQLVLEAERLLDKVLGQPDLDGDSLCQLIRRCASWLHAPIFKALAGDEPSLSDGQHPMNLQCRVRKLLIRALDHLDLSDRPTFEAVEAAMLHLHTLVQQVDLKLSSRTDRSSDSARQWLKLRELVRGSSSESSFPGSVVAYHGRQGVAPTTIAEDFLPAERSRVCKRQRPAKQVKPAVRGGYLKCFAGSVYEPSSKIQALRSIFKSEPHKVKCSECAFTISSSWRFQHPKTRAIAILVPSNGHNACQHRLKKRCFWRALGQIRSKSDVHANLNFCCHDRLLMQCAPCGGQMMCHHGRQRYQCKDCGGGRICEHEKRRDACKICRHLPKQRKRGAAEQQTKGGR